MKIWISYSFEDKEFVDKLTHSIILKGDEVIRIDNTISAGEILIEKITQAINSADALILVMSKNYFKSKWMSLETSLILTEISSKNSKIFIPILLESNLKIPAYLSSYYYIDFSNENKFEDNVGEILKAITTINPRIYNYHTQKSISVALKKQEVLLKNDMSEYEMKKKSEQNFKLFYLITLITTLLTSIVVIAIFVEKEKGFSSFKDDSFNITSFILGVITSLTSLGAYFTYKKNKVNGRK